MKLDAVRGLALSLPEATERPHFELTSFRVRGKIFATAPADGSHLNLFVSEEQRELALTLHPDFVEKLWWGKKVAGLRVALATAEPAIVEALLRQAWANRASKALVASEEGLKRQR